MIIAEENLKYHLFYPIDKKDGIKKQKQFYIGITFLKFSDHQ